MVIVLDKPTVTQRAAPANLAATRQVPRRSGLQPGKPEVVVFDLQGVIGRNVNTLPFFPTLLRNRISFISERLGIPYDEAERYSEELHRNKRTDPPPLALLKKHGIPIADYVRSVYDPLMPALRECMGRDDELIALFKSLRTEKRMILSGTPQTYIDTSLAAQGLTEQIDRIIPLEELAEIGQAKPRPAPYKLVEDLSKTRGSGIFILENSPANLAVPSAFGWRTVQILDDPSNEISQYADYAFRSLAEALQWLTGGQ